MNKKINNKDFEGTREEIHRQMLSTVSHDLKTPLATMIGSLEVFLRMQEKLSPEKKETLINSALSEAYRLDQFITNILDMAKLENGLVNIRVEKCNLSNLLEDCLVRLGQRRDKAQLKIDVETTAPKVVDTDGNLLGRAVVLVLENALKHAGKSPVINIRVFSPSVGVACIEVQDNGPGIPAGKEEAIFSKYTRLAKSDAQTAGTGLGLSICRQIMKLLGGEVNVKNSPNGGAVFTLCLPA